MKASQHLHCTVVLCTYNGAAYIKAQLDSLLAQTRLPDTLVVGDDGSTDNTLDILAEFRNKAPFPVIIYPEEKLRSSPSANFARTLEKASGDWFALCDQDDIWHADKLESLETALTADSGTIMAFSNADLVGADLAPLGSTMWHQVGLDNSALNCFYRDEALALLLKRYRVMGAAMAFTDELRSWALPIPSCWPHDAWIALLAAAIGKVVAVPKPLLSYRQHGNNVVGGFRPSYKQLLEQSFGIDRKSYLIAEITRYRLLMERLVSINNPDRERLSRSRRLVRGKLAHLERRAELPDMPLARWPAIFRDWAAGEYRRWTTDWRSLALDLFMFNRSK